MYTIKGSSLVSNYTASVKCSRWVTDLAIETGVTLDLDDFFFLWKSVYRHSVEYFTNIYQNVHSDEDEFLNRG